jgi:hypothetical protein
MFLILRGPKAGMRIRWAIALRLRTKKEKKKQEDGEGQLEGRTPDQNE